MSATAKVDKFWPHYISNDADGQEQIGNTWEAWMELGDLFIYFVSRFLIS